MIKMKKAFSLIEVIFVLVILGIVASISSQIIVQVYENYITQKALYNTTTKTEIAINQIVNRLTYAIDGTTVTKNPTSSDPYTKGVGWIKLSDIDVNNNNHRQFTTIEWIGYDNDSFSATVTPLWSGVAKYDTAGGATRESFETPGSNLNSVATIMNNLSNGKVDLNNSNPAAVIFSEENNEYILGVEYDPTCMGLINPANTACIFPVQIGNAIGGNDTNLTFTRANEPKIITERYKLAWSAYALVPEASTTNPGLFDLFLYSNYQPWNNEAYVVGDKNLLINNVSVFKFTENGGVIQLKLCASENIGKDYNISSCKEKAIIQ